MRSMPDKNQKQYSPSIIIEHDLLLDPFEVFSKWLKTQENREGTNFSPSALLNNPSLNFINPEGESIKIKDIRNFNQELAFSNYDSNKRYFIFLNSDLTTLQAQNAALKSIEEPPVNTQIVLLTSTLDKLLPTIISRCKVISIKKSSTQKETPKDFEEISKIYKKIINSKHYELIELSNTYKDRATAVLFFNQLLSYLNFELHSNNSEYEKNQLTKHLKIILKTNKQLNQNVNVKLAIENCFFDLIK